MLKIAHPRGQEIEIENLLILHLNVYQAVTTKSTTPFVIDFAFKIQQTTQFQKLRPLPQIPRVIFSIVYTCVIVSNTGKYFYYINNSMYLQTYVGSERDIATPIQETGHPNCDLSEYNPSST